MKNIYTLYNPVWTVLMTYFTVLKITNVMEARGIQIVFFNNLNLKLLILLVKKPFLGFGLALYIYLNRTPPPLSIYRHVRNNRLLLQMKTPKWGPVVWRELPFSPCLALLESRRERWARQEKKSSALPKTFSSPVSHFIYHHFFPIPCYVTDGCYCTFFYRIQHFHYCNRHFCLYFGYYLGVYYKVVCLLCNLLVIS